MDLKKIAKIITIGSSVSTIAIGALIFTGSLALIPGVILVACAGLAPKGLALWMTKQAEKDSKQLTSSTNPSLEHQILQIAHNLGGRATPTEIALKTNTTLDKATEALQKMQEKGYAELEITDSEAIIYQFSGFLSLDDRQNTVKRLD